MEFGELEILREFRHACSGVLEARDSIKTTASCLLCQSPSSHAMQVKGPWANSPSTFVPPASVPVSLTATLIQLPKGVVSNGSLSATYLKEVARQDLPWVP